MRKKVIPQQQTERNEHIRAYSCDRRPFDLRHAQVLRKLFLALGEDRPRNSLTGISDD